LRISFKTFGLIVGPTLFFIIHQARFMGGLEPLAWSVLALAVWMVVWWITEAAPMAVTALLPIVVFPAVGVFTLVNATAPYASTIIFLFMGGFFLALGLEEHNLHRRIALSLIKVTGTSANGIVLGFMIATAFLSMWISNTASTIMMLPIAASVVALIEQNSNDKKGLSLFAVSLMLGIAYSANIGGMATIIGTPPNVVFVGYVQELLGYEIDFADWLMIGVPISSLLLLVTYLMLTKVLYPNTMGKIEHADDLINAELRKLGSMSKEEKMVAVIFGLTAAMWIFKRPINSLLPSPILNDTATAIIGGIMMFVTPVSFKTGKTLVPWSATSRLPWGILLLFGGGMTLAKGMEKTGLIDLIGTAVAQNQLSTWLIFLILIAAMLFLTELMSNVALATIFIPVTIAIGQGTGINPLLLSIPVAMAASCAFMMPISTPPNAIVFSSGKIKMTQMVRAGFLLNLISVGVLLFCAFTLIEWVFG
jgi:sodium-dependent dicarboxylate transporter 2/3/5